MDFGHDDPNEAKRRLEEAKTRLREEQRRLKEEMRAAKIKSRGHRLPGDEFSLKPWMIWDIAVVFLVIILFSVAMYYPRPGLSTETTDLTGAAVAGTQAVANTAPKTTELVIENISEGVILKEEEEEPITIEKGPQFSLSLEDEEGNVLDELATTANNFRYNIVIKNLESEFLLCNGDRTIDDDVDLEYYKNLKMHPVEKEELPNVLLGEGRTEVKYDISCRFLEGSKETKLSAEFDVIFEDGTIIPED